MIFTLGKLFQGKRAPEFLNSLKISLNLWLVYISGCVNKGFYFLHVVIKNLFPPISNGCNLVNSEDINTWVFEGKFFNEIKSRKYQSSHKALQRAHLSDIFSDFCFCVIVFHKSNSSLTHYKIAASKDWLESCLYLVQGLL